MPFLLKLLGRAIVGVVMLLGLVGLGYVGGWPFFLIVAVLAVVALSEYYSALQTTGARPNVTLGWLCTVLVLYVTQYSQRVRELSGLHGTETFSGVNLEAEADVLQLILFVLLFCVAGTLLAQFKLRSDQSAVVNTATTVFGVVYIGILLAFVLRMRYLDVPSITGGPATDFARRMGGLLLVILPVWMCDTVAYLAGNLWGRTKLAPVVSPNKTVEGSVAGLTAAIIGALLLGAWWLGLPILHAALLGLMMGTVGQLGDLCKSVLKRDIGIKDFGSFFGPHGGVLDRFDSTLFCMPLVYWYFWFIFIKGVGA